MGGMSSFSFDRVYSPEAGDCSGKVQFPEGAHEAKRGTGRSHRLPAVAAISCAVSEASPWVVSTMRRLVDMAVALVALVIFAPLMLLAAAMVRFGSRGPVLFRQRRMGRHGKEFTLYKFRSMTPKEGSGSSITVCGDARVTRVGAILRRYKLDELPQFWNVLKGDMGLVGPRPKLPHLEPLHLTCRPGITGIATLAFHKEEEFLSAIPEAELEAFYELFVKPTKAKMDREYMRSATFRSDVAILWRTATSCLFGSCEAQVESAATLARSVSSWQQQASALRVHEEASPRRVESGMRTVSATLEY